MRHIDLRASFSFSIVLFLPVRLPFSIYARHASFSLRVLFCNQRVSFSVVPFLFVAEGLDSITKSRESCQLDQNPKREPATSITNKVEPMTKKGKSQTKHTTTPRNQPSLIQSKESTNDHHNRNLVRKETCHHDKHLKQMDFFTLQTKTKRNQPLRSKRKEREPNHRALTKTKGT